MKALLDTNVLLDVLLDRAPFVNDSAKVMDQAATSGIEGYVCATTVTTLDYLMNQQMSKQKSASLLRKLLDVFQVAPVNRWVLDQAIDSRLQDFEDAVIEQSAYLCGVDYIVTRNLKDYKKSVVPAIDPSRFLTLLPWAGNR